MAAPPSFPSSPSSSFSSLSDQDLDIWLGPSTTLPGKLGSRDDTLSRMSRDDILSLANCRSTKRCVRLSDFMRLNSLPAKDGQQLQLSFGSALHVGDGTNVLCKVCSFHKPPLRICKKGAFCDFCHLHDGRRNGRRRSLRDETGRMTWADTEVQVLQGIRL
ncbi:bst1 [Symbiodinium natans]|uniref:Bst1 protein n=1 Tax=Symbiodinium natans TaxID=878477 RepID=A0A812IJQ9_9DINO|nr:bst1 [Symbiodinium natans]